MRDFEKFEGELLHKEKLNILLTGKKVSNKKYKHVYSVWKKFGIKKMKIITLYLKWDV